MISVAAKQDESSALLHTLVSSLLSSFSPADVISDKSTAVCATALMKVTLLSKRGYLVGIVRNAQLLAELISVYTSASTTSVNGGTATVSTSYDVSTAASWLVEGVQLGMASGELPVSLVTPNIQLSITSTLISSSSNVVLTTPATASQLTYGSIQPKITLGSDGLKYCSAISGYAQLSALQWSINPYAGSTAVQSPLLRLTYTAQAVIATVQNYGRVTSMIVQSAVPISVASLPAYYVALQFSFKLNFNFSAISSIITARSSNLTFPACTLYNGTAYVPCRGCNISSYTDYNVTYSCFDITQLCPSSRVRRHLGDEDHGSSKALITDDNYSSKFNIEKRTSHDEDTADRYHRSLARRYPSTGTPQSSLSYGVVIHSVKVEFVDVLSFNPSKLDLAHSTVILTFMGCLCGFIVIMALFLFKTDHYEKVYKDYLKSEVDNLARKLLKDEIRKGGNDDIGPWFQTRVSSLHLKIKSMNNFSNRLSRISSRTVGTNHKRRAVYISGEMYRFDEREKDEFDTEVDGSDDDSTESIIVDGVGIDGNEHLGTAAVVTEFFLKLFPGRSIFMDITNNNCLKIVGVHHNYLSMLADSSVAQTRTIRFCNVISIILTAIFADTLLFGILEPVQSACSLMTDQVMERIRRRYASHCPDYSSAFLLHI